MMYTCQIHTCRTAKDRDHATAIGHFVRAVAPKTPDLLCATVQRAMEMLHFEARVDVLGANTVEVYRSGEVIMTWTAVPL